VNTDRRTFLQLATAASGAFALSGGPRIGWRDPTPRYRGLPDVPSAPVPLNLLILGGTGLTGPHQVRYALARGHRVTVFNRGRRNQRLPAGVTQLQGDRDLHQVDALKSRDWDVVIDNPPMFPFWIYDAAQVLKGHTGQYVFISTISVYDPAGQTSIEEGSPLLKYTGADPLAETRQTVGNRLGEMYGPLKAQSEMEALRQYGEAATTIIRPGLIVGPGDETFRFTYWPWRIAQGGEIVAPGDGTDPVQIIDARDLAEWTIRVVERRTTGVFNATGPRARLSMGAMLHGVRAAYPGDTDLNLVWIPWEFLKAHEVQPWQEMTTWIPDEDPESVISRTRVDRAIAAGLTFRPLADTAAAALQWLTEQPAEEQERIKRRAGLPADKEQKVLAAWRERRPS
jgi:2'-hydroxyisoflavone reductase